jgi:cytochrome oxidase Cu insertion factor (SCO1/SenC/PrrC family)
MKFPALFFCILSLIDVSAQFPGSKELYKQIGNYYKNNPGSVDYVEHMHKNALGYDTVRSSFAYIPGEKGSFMLAAVDSEFIVTGGMLISQNIYVLDITRRQRIRVKKKELGGTIYSMLDFSPAFHSNELEKTFGTIQSYNKSKDQYQVLTSKYILKVDTFTFRIKSLQRSVLFEGRMQYDLYKYISLSDSVQTFLKNQVAELVEVSNNFEETTFKQLTSKKIPVNLSEGQLFAFANLESFNKGALDTMMKGKYVILDFFYQTCYPCHRMTNWILEWLPTVDSSRIVLIGVDPMDSESSMKLFVKDRKISYPVIIGSQAMDIAQRYHISAYPTLFLISPDGTIRAIHEGMSKNFLEKAEKIVSR